MSPVNKSATGSTAANSSAAGRARAMVLAGYQGWRRRTLRRSRVFGPVALVAGLWLLFLGTILCSYGFWWGAALIAVSALELRAAIWLLSAAGRDARTADPHPQR